VFVCRVREREAERETERVNEEMGVSETERAICSCLRGERRSHPQIWPTLQPDPSLDFRTEKKERKKEEEVKREVTSNAD